VIERSGEDGSEWLTLPNED